LKRNFKIDFASKILIKKTHIQLHILMPGPSFYVSGEENDFKKETVVVSTNINILYIINLLTYRCLDESM
jgi:hypothetical protein